MSQRISDSAMNIIIYSGNDFRKEVKRCESGCTDPCRALWRSTGLASGRSSGTRVMNYDAFMEPVTWFLTGMEKHSDERQNGSAGAMQIILSGQ